MNPFGPLLASNPSLPTLGKGVSSSGLGMLSSATGAISDIANLGFGIWDRIQSQKNYQASADYQKALNDQIMAREDTAYQRAVEDIKSAGLSPLALTSGAPVSAMSGTNPQSVSGQSASALASARLATLAGLKQQIELQKNNQAIEWYNAMTARMNVLELINDHNKNRPIAQQNANSASTTAQAATSQAESAATLAGVGSDVRDINKYYAEKTGLPYGVVGQSSEGASVSVGPFKASGHSTGQVSVNPPKSVKEFMDEYTGSEYQVLRRLNEAHDADGDFTANSFILKQIVNQVEQLYQEYKKTVDSKNWVNFYSFKAEYYNKHSIPWFKGTHGEPTIDIQALNRRYHSSR